MAKAPAARRPPKRGRASSSTSDSPASLVDAVAYLLLACGTIAVIPGGLNRFVFAKLVCLAGGSAIAFLRPATGRLPRTVVLATIAALVVSLVAGLAGPAPVVQLLGRAPRYEGPIVLALYLLVAGASARLWGPGATETAWRWLVRGLAGSAVAVGTLATLESFGVRLLSSTFVRPGSLLGNASDLAAWGLLALGPLALVAMRTRDRWAITGTVGATLAVAASASRGGLLGLLVVAAGIAWYLPNRQRVRLVGVALVVLVMAAFVFPLGSRLTGGDPFAAASVTGRTQIWSQTVALIRDHLLLGVGPGGYVDSITPYRDDTWYRTVGVDNPPDSPHQFVLQVLSAGGLLGLAAALSVSAAFVVAFRRRFATAPLHGEHAGNISPAVVRGLVIGLTGYATALLVSFTSPGTAGLAALACGVAAAAPTVSRPRRVQSTAAAVTSAAFCLGALAGAIAELPLKSSIVALQAQDERAGQTAFQTASAWRPWDVSISTIAGHAFSVLAVEGSPTAPEVSTGWLKRETGTLPRSAPLFTDLGTAYEAQGDLASASLALNRAQQLDPHNPAIMLRLGVVEARQGNLRNAETLLLNAAANSPHSPDPWTNLAIVYRLEHRTTDETTAQARADLLTHATP